MEGFLTQRATRKQSVFAGAAALFILHTVAVAASSATLALPVIHSFMLVYALTALGAAGIAGLLGAQFAVTRQPILGVLCGAYAFSVMALFLQLLTLSGVFDPTGFLGTRSHTFTRMWVFRHGGFSMFVIVAVFTHIWFERRQICITDRGSWACFLIGGPVVIAAAFFGFMVYGEQSFVLSSSTGIGAFPNYATFVVIWSLNVIAMVVVLLTGRLRAVIDLWLVVALLACLADTTLSLLSEPRFSMGWYLVETLSMSTTGVLAGVLIWEAIIFYRRLFDAHASLLQTSIRDALTGVFNRSYFNEQFRREFDKAKRTGIPLSLIMVDVDHFKRYNDAFGHLKGDACLAAVASSLAEVVRRPADFVARYGGEEFAIVLPDADLHGASEIAVRVRDVVIRLRLHAPTPLGYVTVSVGCASFEQGNQASMDELIGAADAALYRAKVAGRNQIHLAEEH
jgi:diguanylate cyclase (GGDEF)-like protein